LLAALRESGNAGNTMDAVKENLQAGRYSHGGGSWCWGGRLVRFQLLAMMVGFEQGYFFQNS
jgi:hypothetical protein